MAITIPTGKVTWTLLEEIPAPTFATIPVEGLVRFEPTAVAVGYQGVTLLPATQDAVVKAGVMESVQLPVNNPEIWNWRVSPLVGRAWPAFHIDVTSAGVDLATAAVVPGVGPIRAVRGPAGPASTVPGPPGPASTITIGTVTKATEPGATMTGDAPDQVLNLVLPKGDPGPASTVPGPPGPANALSIGTVTSGKAAASITGAAPQQILNLTLPPGPQGDVGPASTVPGPAGKTAYQYAVEQGFKGTEAEYAAATIPSLDWSKISGKPTTFTPASHNHTAAEITDLSSVLSSMVPSTWERLPLTDPWAQLASAGGGYYRGARIRTTPSGVQVQAMITGGDVGSMIATLPDARGITFSAIFPISTSTDIGHVLVNVSAGTVTLSYLKGPAKPSWINVSILIPT